MCGLQSTEVLEFWWGYPTNLSIMASLPKLALHPYLAPPGLPARCRSSRQSYSFVHERGDLDQVVYIDLFADQC